MNCLLVDDEPGIREGLAALLRRQGHVVQTAADCAAAARALAERAFDVVISDWRLPDGLAATFVDACPCPVIAISGHPEEVHTARPVHTVLTKPVAPSVLARAIADAVAPPAYPAARPLASDAREVFDAFVAALPAGVVVEMCDDGAFAVARATVPVGAVDGMRASGGDLRIAVHGASATVELRVCRDGRPDPGLPVVRAGAPWPDAAELAVDFDDVRDGGTNVPELFAACLDGARAAASRGRRVHFVNVPDSLRTFAASQGRAHDMPMREPVGPRLPADLADLWSLP